MWLTAAEIAELTAKITARDKEEASCLNPTTQVSLARAAVK